MPFENQILIDNITDTYGPGTHHIGPLELACNWQTDLYFGPVQNPISVHGHTGLIAFDYVQDQVCGNPQPPVCTITISPTAVLTGATSTLAWTTSNATSFAVNHGIGNLMPVSNGATSTGAITATTTFVGTATGPGGTVSCSAAVSVVPPPPPLPTCTLSANPATITQGGSSTLSWTSTNVTSVVFDQGIGSTTPVASGFRSVSPGSTTTYTATFSGANGSVSCSATVNVNPPGGGGGGPVCSLTISPSSVVTGNSATLTWGGSSIQSVFINNGIGTTSSVSGSQSIQPAIGSHTYTGTFIATNGQTLSCSASIEVTGGGGGGGCTSNCGGCTSNCGGGGGGGGTTPGIVLGMRTSAEPLAFVYLSQVPYTGLELGPVGTVLYWLAVIGWSLAAAYLILFVLLPYLGRKMREFGGEVTRVLNATTPVAAVALPMAAPALLATEERGYSTYDGFRSFAKPNGALTIDDIVQGLARSGGTERFAAEPTPAPAPEPARARPQNTEPIYDRVEPIFDRAESVERAAPAQPVSTDVRGFISALLEGDRNAVFSALRMQVRGGGSAEQYLTRVVTALDDVYRARIDGTPVDGDIARLTARLDTPTLEKLIMALTNAIDSSYSAGVTGAKLALARALGTIGA